jgi:hypothetical protein
MFKGSQLITHMWSKLFIIGTVGRVFSMRVELTYSGVQKSTNRVGMNYFNLQSIPAKLSRSA